MRRLLPLGKLTLLLGGVLASLSCDEHVTYINQGTRLLYSTSFEDPADTVGWSYRYPWGRRYDEGAPGKGQHSLRVYNDQWSATAVYTLPWVDQGSTVLLNFHARNLGPGVGECRIRVEGRLPSINQFILDTNWTEYSISGVFSTGGDLKVELFGSVGRDNTVLFDGISVYLVEVN